MKTKKTSKTSRTQLKDMNVEAEELTTAEAGKVKGGTVFPPWHKPDKVSDTPTSTSSSLLKGWDIKKNSGG